MSVEPREPGTCLEVLGRDYEGKGREDDAQGLEGDLEIVDGGVEQGKQNDRNCVRVSERAVEGCADEGLRDGAWLLKLVCRLNQPASPVRHLLHVAECRVGL